MRHQRGNVAIRIALSLAAMVVLLLGSGTLYITRERALGIVRPSERDQYTETPADYGMPGYRDLTLTSADGTALQAWYVPSQNGAVILLAHGFQSSRAALLGEAGMLHEHGYGVLLWDFRACGRSGGEITTVGGAGEVADLQAAVDYALAQPDLTGSPKRLGALGNSMGAVTVLRGTARIPDIQAVVAVSPFYSLEGEVTMGVERFAHLPAFPFAPLIVWWGQRESGTDVTQNRAIDDVAAISPRAVFLMAAGQDTVVPPESGQLLYDAAREPKQLWFQPDIGHVQQWTKYPQEYERRVVAFFDQYLPGR